MTSAEHFQFLAARRRMRTAAVIVAACAVVFGAFGAERAGRYRLLTEANLEELRRAVVAHPRDDELAIALAYRLDRDGRFEEALPIMRRLAARHPGSATYWTGLAQTFAGMGRSAEAAQAYERAVALDPRDAAAHRALGQLYSSAHLYTDALQEFDRAADLDPAYRDGSDAWARALIGKGKPERAWQIQKELVLRQPLDDNAFITLTDAAIRARHLDEAAKILRWRSGLIMPYRFGIARWCLARVLLARSRDSLTLAKAQDELETAIMDSTKLVDFYVLLGRVRMQRGDLEGAREALEEGLDSTAMGARSECAQVLAGLCARQGDSRRAAQVRVHIRPPLPDPAAVVVGRKAVRAAPNDAGARLALAAALESAGHCAEAAEECHAALRLKPDDRTARSMLAVCRTAALQKLSESSSRPSGIADAAG